MSKSIEIKCPKCAETFKIPAPATITKAKLRVGITICKHCGVPLVNHNNCDHWEILEPEDLSVFPEEMRDSVGMAIASALMSHLKNIVDSPEPETPFTRNHFFMKRSATASEGCVVLYGEDEWDSFATVTNLKNRPDMVEAMKLVALTETKQKYKHN